ncbi:MAG: hypothetical protein H0U53_00870 [Actinobacteria bacterium]|nr:hypothetical protein [Actinomycetota bacterium]
METPNVTQIQILALVTSVLGLVVALGLIDNDQSQLILGVASTALPIVFTVADMFIRTTRAKNADAIARAKLAAPQTEKLADPFIAGA